MEPHRFDALAKELAAASPSRRSVLRAVGGGIASGVLAAVAGRRPRALAAPGTPPSAPVPVETTPPACEGTCSGNSVLCCGYPGNCLGCPAGRRPCCAAGGCQDPTTSCCTDADCAGNMTCQTTGGRFTCACPAGKTDCHGTCTDTGRDPANCGGCGSVCPAGQSCCGGHCLVCPVGSVCTYQGNFQWSCVCPAAYPTVCGNTCVDLQTDDRNCDGCGLLCQVDVRTCQGGACVCRSDLGLTACAGDCVFLEQDPTNCGTCGHRCARGQVCSSGRCRRPPPPCRGRCDTNCRCPDDSVCNRSLHPPRCTPLA